MGGGAGKSRRYTANEVAHEVITIGADEGAEKKETEGRTSKSPNHGVSLKLGTLSVPFAHKGSHEFRPDALFLKTIASPTTQLSLYCRTIILEAIKVLEADRCSLYFVDEIRKEVWCIGALDCELFRLPLQRGIVGLCARDAKTLNISDPHSHESFDKTVEQQTGYMVCNMLTVPIRHMVDQHRAVGVIQCFNKQAETAFTSQDERVLEEVGTIISDSFYRQRWRAFESSAKFDRSGLALLATLTAEVQSKPRLGSAEGGVSGPAPMSSFKWLNTEKLSQDVDVTVEESASLEVNAQTADVGGGARSSNSVSLRCLTFDTLAHPAADLVKMVPVIFDGIGVQRSGCAMPEDRMRSWVWAVERSYRSNPFHNWFHAFSVFQCCYAQLWTCKFSCLSFLDVFAILIAALCHDLGHPGVTNSFLMDSEDELAIRYNDISVLENHHAFLACELLRKDETAIGACLSKADQVAMRRTIIKSILDTDMVRHSELCQQTLARVGTSCDAESDRQWFLSVVLHSSDLSAQLHRWPVAAAWEERISQEFVNQASLEIAAGRQPAPFMQFAMDDLQQRAKLQRNFIDYVLVPLWDPFTQLQPALRPCFERLLANRAKYEYRSIHGCDPPPGTEDDARAKAT